MHKKACSNIWPVLTDHQILVLPSGLYTCHVTNVYALVLYDNVVCKDLRVKKFVSKRARVWI